MDISLSLAFKPCGFEDETISFFDLYMYLFVRCFFFFLILNMNGYFNTNLAFVFFYSVLIPLCSSFQRYIGFTASIACFKESLSS